MAKVKKAKGELVERLDLETRVARRILVQLQELDQDVRNDVLVRVAETVRAVRQQPSAYNMVPVEPTSADGLIIR